MDQDSLLLGDNIFNTMLNSGQNNNDWLSSGYFLAALIIMGFAWWKVYEKAGYEGWKALIPFYNIYIFTKIITKPAYWTIFLLIPIINIIFYIWGMNLLSKKFKQGVGFTIGMVLIPYVFIPILAFGNYTYHANK